MKQTKVVIVGLALALLFLGFSLGFYVTNRAGEVEIPAEAAYTEAADTVVMNLPNEEQGTPGDVFVVAESGVTTDEEADQPTSKLVMMEPEVNQAPDPEPLLIPESTPAEPVEAESVPAQQVEEPEPSEAPSAPEVASDPAPTLVAGTWNLSSVDSSPVSGEYELFAKSGSRFGGETPCNAFYGAYAADGSGHTKTTSFGDTGVSCGETEAIVRQVLEQGQFSYRNDRELVVLANTHELVFVR